MRALHRLARPARVASLLGAGLLVCGLALALLRTEDDPAPWYVLEPAELDVGPVPVGTRDVAFAVHNRSRSPRRVIGLSERCFKNVCVESLLTDPLTVAPGDRAQVRFRLSLSRPGEFEAPIVVYFDDAGIGQAAITIRGVVIPTQGERNETASHP